MTAISVLAKVRYRYGSYTAWLGRARASCVTSPECAVRRVAKRCYCPEFTIGDIRPAEPAAGDDAEYWRVELVYDEQTTGDTP
jgi:hypothetical protein